MNNNLFRLVKEHSNHRINYISSDDTPIIESSDFLFIYDRKTLIEISRYNDEWERSYMEKL